MDQSHEKDTSPAPTTRTTSTATPFPSPVRDSKVDEEFGGSPVHLGVPELPRLSAADLVREMQGTFHEHCLVDGDWEKSWLEKGIEEFLIQWLSYDLIEGRLSSLPASVDQGKEAKAIRRGVMPFDQSRQMTSEKNFICVLYVGLEDDHEFCLVKRLLGKGGLNMKRVTHDNEAKVRVRGRGSGFLEGSLQVELDAPLQIHLSCSAWNTYCSVFVALYDLIKDLHKHYRRYARSKGMEPPELKVEFEELRRMDLGLPGYMPQRKEAPSRPMVKINEMTEVLVPVGSHPSGPAAALLSRNEHEARPIGGPPICACPVCRLRGERQRSKKGKKDRRYQLAIGSSTNAWQFQKNG